MSTSPRYSSTTDCIVRATPRTDNRPKTGTADAPATKGEVMNSTVSTGEPTRGPVEAWRPRIAAWALAAVLILSGGVAVPVLAAIPAHAAPAATTWQQAASTGPGAREGAAIVFDEARGQLLLFGGETPGGYSGQTWLWTGSAWQQLFPLLSPSARRGAAIAYDPRSRVVVMYGGESASGPLFDTWTWNGSAWQNTFQFITPGSRTDATMVHDPVSDSLVLFGGSNYGTYLDTTWRLVSGTQWRMTRGRENSSSRVVASVRPSKPLTPGHGMDGRGRR